MDPELKSFFERVESSFCGHRGAPLLLSPLDFQKALEWFGEGVPGDAVEEGVGRYFRKLDERKTPRRQAICLSFAERHILKVLEERRTAAVGRAAGISGDPDPGAAARSFLHSRLESIARFLSGGAPPGFPVLKKAMGEARATLEELLSRADEPFASLERELKPLDEEVVRLALLESPPEKADAWRQGAMERLRPYAGGMDPASLRHQVDQLARKEAMKDLGLPRLSLIFWEGSE